MKIKIIAILFISVAMVSFASTRVVQKAGETGEKIGNTREVAKSAKPLGFVSEEL